MRLSTALIIFGMVLISGALLAGCKKRVEGSSPVQLKDRFAKLQIGSKTYSVEVARTPVEQQQGLSGRDEIGSDGMLFPFSPAKKAGFWMIDMKFDLDFIWMVNGKVIEITRNVKKPEPGQSPSQLPNYYPNEPIDMMLEVTAGFAEKEGIKVGDPVQLFYQQ